jgi:ribulose-5-phosphate 4-epimerase/fuculose-1-phosphate aldolase
MSAAHSHSLYGKTLAASTQHLEPLTQDACVFYQDHAVFEEFSGVVFDVEYGRRIAATLGSNKAVILRNHGLLTAGATVDSAVWWFITLERSCQAQLIGKAAGPVHAIDHENAKLTHDQLGTELMGWLMFQPLFDKISRSDPDLFD